jgi:hypothetical protein
VRITALTATLMSLSGCFVFNNLYDKTPAASLQIVVQGGAYAGVYVWNSKDNAYETTIAGIPSSVYMDSGGTWHLTYGAGVVASSTSTYADCTLPPTTSSGWSSPVLSSVDDSEGGISMQGLPPDSQIVGPPPPQFLQVAFQASSPGNRATYQWQKSPDETFQNSVPIGNGSTYSIQSGDYGHWFRVIITPTDSSGAIQGSPVASQPVDWP